MISKKSKKSIIGIVLFLSIIITSLFLPMKKMENVIGLITVIILFITAAVSIHAQDKILGEIITSTHKENLSNEVKRKKSTSKLIFYGGILIFALLSSIAINRLINYYI
jgi:cytosine/uracil/thiamine/allantoin permease